MAWKDARRGHLESGSQAVGSQLLTRSKLMVKVGISPEWHYIRSWPLISLYLEFLWNSSTQKQLSCKGEYTLHENQISNHHIFPTQFGFILCISWFCSSEISPLWSSGLTSNLIVWRKFTNFFVCLFKRERVQACWFIREQEEEAHAVFGPAPSHLHMLGFDPGKPPPWH
jgi:hypothetical protein